jgi:hypothetical protein
MSNLQNKAKPILLPFLRGAWPSLTPQDQAILSKWAAMFTMVHEFADPTTAVIPISNRMSLQSSQVMPENWIVFIAPFGGIKQNGGAWHRSWRVFSSSESEKQTEIGGMQTTLFAAGQIFFQTFSSTQQVSDNFLKRFKQSARSLHLRKIWPIGLAGINGKKIRYRLNDDDFEIVMTTTTHLLNAKNPGRFE